MAKQKQTQRNAYREKLKSLEAEILELKNQSSAINTDDIESLKEIELIEKKRTKNLKQYYELKKKISDLNAKNVTAQTEEERNQEQHLKNVERSEKDINDLREKSNILMRSLNQDTQTAAKILGIASQETERLAGQMKIFKDLSATSNEQNDAFNKSMKAAVNNASSLDSISVKIAEGMENINEKGYQLIDTYQLERSLKEQSARLDLNIKDLGIKRYVLLKSENDAHLKKLETIKKTNVMLEKQANSAKQSKALWSQGTAAFIGMVAAVPAGNFLMNKMGLANVLNKSKTIGETIKGWGASLAGMAVGGVFAGLLGILNLIIAAFKFIIGTAFELDKRIANVGETLSVSRSRATQLEKQFANLALSVNAINVNTEQFLETVSNLTEEYGVVAEKVMSANSASGWVKNMTLLREKFKMTNEESLNFGRIASIMNTSMDGLAFSATKLTKNLMNSRQMLKAMANVPQIMAVGMKGAVDQLVKFVAKAKMMGIDLKGFADAMSNMLDIESSLDKQFTMETITGIHFNNADAIRLAVGQMKYNDAFDMFMSNVGQVRSLADMPGGLIGVRSMAEFFGFSLDQFTEYFNRFQELKKVFGGKNPMAEAQKYMEMSSKELRALLNSGKLSGDKAKKGFIENLVAEKEAADIQTKFTDKMNKIKIAMMDSTLPIIEELHSIFMELVNSPELKGLMYKTLKNLPDIIKSIIDMGKQLKNLIGIVFDFMKQIGIITETTKTNADGTTDKILSLNKAFFDLNNILLSIAGLVIGKKLFSFFGGKLMEAGWQKLTGKGIQAASVAAKTTSMGAGGAALFGTGMLSAIKKKRGASGKSLKTSTSNLSSTLVGKRMARKTGMNLATNTALKGASKFGLKSLLKGAGKAVPYLGLALSAYDAYDGWNNAAGNLDLDRNKPASLGMKAASASGSLLSGLTLGLVDSKMLSKGIYSMFGGRPGMEPSQTEYQNMAQTMPQEVPYQQAKTVQQKVNVTVNTESLEKKIDKLISIINGMANQPTYIKIGEQTVEAIRSEINWKKQNVIGVDNRYSGGSRD